MTTQYKSYNEVQTINEYGQAFCDQVYTATLTINTDTTVTVPGGATMGAPPAYVNNKYMAVIRTTANSSVWMAKNATAAVPAGATFAASTSELINGTYAIAKYVQAGDVLHFFCASANVSVSVAFYSLPS